MPVQLYYMLYNMSLYFQAVNAFLMFSFSLEMSKKYTNKPQNQDCRSVVEGNPSKEALNN